MYRTYMAYIGQVEKKINKSGCRFYLASPFRKSTLQGSHYMYSLYRASGTYIYMCEMILCKSGTS